MLRGAITGYIDVAQLTLYAFFIFFGFLVLYLRREDKREGYPLESDRSTSIVVQGFPAVPAAKLFRLDNGHVISAPRPHEVSPPIAAAPVGPWPGAPLTPTGDPMRDGVGPAAYANREDVPELMYDGTPLIVPMRTLPDTGIAKEDSDPRGMSVIAADRVVAGTVVDVWIDKAEPQIRYFEVALAADAARHVLLPMTLARVSQLQGTIKVASITAAQFLAVPTLRNPDQVTKLEEDRITAYFGSGHLYAKPSRLGPLL
jgi:photosynthetic reaction center H subunit